MDRSALLRMSPTKLSKIDDSIMILNDDLFWRDKFRRDFPLSKIIRGPRRPPFTESCTFRFAYMKQWAMQALYSTDYYIRPDADLVGVYHNYICKTSSITRAGEGNKKKESVQLLLAPCTFWGVPTGEYKWYIDQVFYPGLSYNGMDMCHMDHIWSINPLIDRPEQITFAIPKRHIDKNITKRIYKMFITGPDGRFIYDSDDFRIADETCYYVRGGTNKSELRNLERYKLYGQK